MIGDNSDNKVKLDYEWNEIRNELTRYGGRPPEILFPILERISDLINDMNHGCDNLDSIENIQTELNNLKIKYI
jgi:hypothetical protein